MQLDIKIDTRAVERALKEMPKLAKRAMVDALKKTATSANTAAKRKISSPKAPGSYNIKAKDIRGKIDIRQPSIADPKAVIRVQGGYRGMGAPIPLVKFGAKQKPKGVMAKLKRSGKRHLYKGTFVRRLKSGHVGVFKHVQGVKTSRGKSKLRELTGPSIAQLYGHRIIRSTIKNVVSDKFPKEFSRRFNYLRARAASKRVLPSPSR